ncbi:hypothetical protein Bsp3421_001375 [Burkholderia sp. FERM BP-3421]|uniref:hypothetical protein n=1 Tax=Burkholderia sp. FERM BP-3421 TaxID=1494466 RepID=UPI0023619068|nr:hypothetical protein [Burkholderia sp. FERM BP-3421]WDD91453.1 hypothetical protein Bsp3421_001375 [Burkholderia sp. FERM BP-3421]
MKLPILCIAGLAVTFAGGAAAAAQFGLQPAQMQAVPQQPFGLRPTQPLPPPPLSFAAPAEPATAAAPARAPARQAACRKLAAQRDALARTAMSAGLTPSTTARPAAAPATGHALVAPAGSRPQAAQPAPDARRAALDARYRQLGCGR